MKLAVLSSLLTLAAATALPQSCQTITDDLGNKPRAMYDYFQSHVCQSSQPCDATVNETAAFLRKNVNAELMMQLAKELKVSSSQQEELKQLAMKADKAVDQSCGAKYGDAKVCGSEASLWMWEQCAQDAVKPIYNSPDAQKHQDSITEEQCQTVKNTVAEDKLWKNTIPKYINKFGQQCSSGQIKSSQ